MQLNLDLDSITHNARTVRELCTAFERTAVAVIKSAYAVPEIISSIRQGGIEQFMAGSIAAGLILQISGSKATGLLGLTPVNRAPEVVRIFTRSAQTELSGILAIDRAAREIGMIHGVVLCVEAGDLREGLNIEELPEFVTNVEALSFGSVSLAGIMVNYGCLRTVLPDAQAIARTALAVSSAIKGTRLTRDDVSIGGSIVIPMLALGAVPPIFGSVRSGEALLLGSVPGAFEAGDCGLRSTMRLCGRILEIRTKWDSHHCSARRRALLDFGDLHTDVRAIRPLLPGSFVADWSTEYTILDVTEVNANLQHDDEIEFSLSYSAMIRAMSCAGVPKAFL
ncbi:alanine racemase [Rhizobium leguminosarum]|uniref:alanine racemase n=1 Tax=Rhizobium leguminosarum TaxID=384 RepID=UPI003F9D64F9